MMRKPPTTIRRTILDLRETAERLQGSASEALARNNPDAYVKAMLYSKAAGYLKGMANWMEEDSKPPLAANNDKPITLNDV